MSLPEEHPSRLGSNHRPSASWMEARVEAYVDDTLPPAEQAAFAARLHTAPRWQAAVQQARRVKKGLRALPQPPCPPEVTRAVFRQTGVRQTGVRQTGVREPHVVSAARADRPAAPRTARFRPAGPASKPRAWQPPLALLLLLLLAAVAALWGQPAPPPAGEASRFTHAEVQHATAEAEWTLTFVARVTHETSTTVRQEVLQDRLTAPTQQAALRALRYFPIATPPPSFVPPSRTNR